MLALLLPALRERPALRVALGGAAVALLTTPLLPPGLPVLVALIGLVFALPVPRSARPVDGDRDARSARPVEFADGDHR
jgi:hypothetical protein